MRDFCTVPIHDLNTVGFGRHSHSGIDQETPVRLLEYCREYKVWFDPCEAEETPSFNRGRLSFEGGTVCHAKEDHLRANGYLGFLRSDRLFHMSVTPTT